MDRVKFTSVNVVLIIIVIVAFSVANICLANVVEFKPGDIVSGNVRYQVTFSNNLVMLLNECSTKSLPPNKKEQCIINLKSKLSESSRIKILLSDQLKQVQASAKKKPQPQAQQSPRYILIDENAIGEKKLQQAIKTILEDQRKIINILKLLGVKDNLSSYLLEKVEREISLASKLSLFGIIFFMGCIGLFLLKRNLLFFVYKEK